MLLSKDVTPSTPIEGVDVYFNLHKRVWSCRCRKKGLVKKHTPVLIAPLGASLVVRESGRQRVLKEQRKNVHAFARIDHGTTSLDLAGWTAFADDLEGGIEISYNPYKGAFFYRKDTEERLDYVASLIMLASDNGPPRCVAIL